MSATAEDNMSITATEASVAGSSVAVTEAEEDADSFAQSRTASENNGVKVILTKEPSIKDIAISNDSQHKEEEEDDDDSSDEYAAPMHLHALRTPAKLKGVRSRSSSRSRSRPGSRRNSVSPPRGKNISHPAGVGELIVGAGLTISPSASIGSSLDGGVPDHHSWSGEMCDPDILLDKLGFRDLDANASQEEMQEMLRRHISSSGNSLPTLNERMSEATMDDAHAFQDLQFVKRAAPSSASSKDELEGGGEDGNGSPEKSPVGGSRRELLTQNPALSSSAVMGSTTYLLNTMYEEDESDDEDDEGGNAGDVIVEIPEGVMSSHAREKGRKNRDTMCTTMAVTSEEEEDGGVILDIPEGMVSHPKVKKNRDTTMAIGEVGGMGSFDDSDAEEAGDVVSGIPEDMKRKGSKKSSVCSINAVAAPMSPASSIEDVDDNEVGVPTDVLEALDISEGKRKLKHRDTSSAVEGKAFDYMEGEEQEGLEDDLSDEVR